MFCVANSGRNKMSKQYFRFRLPVTIGDLFSNADLGLSFTCWSNACLSSELQNLFPCQLTKLKRISHVVFSFSASRQLFWVQFIHFVELRWSVEYLVEVGGVKWSFSIGSCEGTLSEGVWDFLGCNTTVHSLQMRLLGFSKGLTSYIIFFGLGRRSEAKVYAAKLRKNSISECLFVLACWAQ